MSLLTSARFLTTVAQLRQLPAGHVPEVAFVGRSNAGKSTAINTLCNRRRLAFASRTPGRTQALNYFSVGPEVGAAVAYIVDTPGYGYASAPKEVKKEWDTLGGRYLQKREQLRGVVLIADIRRQITALDEALLAWAPPHAELLVLASKCDKLNLSEQALAARAISAKVATLRRGAPFKVQLFSALNRRGIDEARAIIEGWLLHEADAPSPGNLEVPL